MPVGLLFICYTKVRSHMSSSLCLRGVSLLAFSPTFALHLAQCGVRLTKKYLKLCFLFKGSSCIIYFNFASIFIYRFISFLTKQKRKLSTRVKNTNKCILTIIAKVKLA